MKILYSVLLSLVVLAKLAVSRFQMIWVWVDGAPIDDELMFRIEGPDEEEPEEDYDELERAAAKLPDEPEEDD